MYQFDICERAEYKNLLIDIWCFTCQKCFLIWSCRLHKKKSKCIKKCTRDYLGPHEVLRPLPLSGYVETHPDRGRGTGPLPLSGCVSTYL